jgi:MinD superfamily P-loop ATPase
MGFLALCSPTRIQRNPDTCIGCKSCSEACPYDLPVDDKRYIRSPECNGCMECTRVCPVENALMLKTKGTGKTFWNAAKLGTVIIGIYIMMVYTAGITGHWKSSVTEHEFRARLQTIDSPEITHPKVRFK